MAIRFKDTISINEEYTFPSQDGTADQILATDGAGNISFVDVAGGEAVKIECKNTSGSTITKGTPVYVTGTVGTSFRVEVAPADASNSAKMPAVGLLETDLANNGEGYVVTGGLLKNLTTDPIDGTNTTSNDTIYVKAGGGLTMTKPTGSNLIQNIGKVGRVSSANSGSVVVSSILRTNDVPNLTEGKIWVGSANNTIESTVVHIDETNERVGINKTSPAVDLDILNSTSSGIVRIVDTNSADVRLAASGNASSVGTNSTHDFNIKTNNAVRMTIDSSGNVGVGSQNPVGKFEVNTGSSAAYFTRTAGDNGGTAPAFGILTDASLTRLYSWGTGMTFWTASVGGTTTERLRISSSGQTTAYNDFIVETSSPEIYLNTTSASHYSWMIAAQENVNAALEITPTTTAGGSTYSTPVATFYANGTSTFAGPVISEGPDGGMVMREWTAGSTFGMIGTANMAGQEYALLTDGTSTFIGSAAGGTTYIRGPVNDDDPEILLDGSQVLVRSNGADTLFGIQGNSSGQYDPILNFLASGNSIATEGAQIWYDNDVGDLHISTTYANDAADIHFYTRTGADKGTSNERLTISGNGNVGIGSASPAYKLDVNGNAKLDYSLIGRGVRSANRGEFHLNSTGATDVAEMFFGYGSGYTEANIRWGISDRGSADDRLVFYKGPYHGGFTEMFTIKSTSEAQFGNSVWVNTSGSVNYNGYNENIRLFNAANGVSTIAFGASGASGTPSTSILGFSDRFETRYSTQWQTRVYNGYAQAYGSYRAPIFYDSNDTGYYLDANNTTTSLVTRGKIINGPNTTWSKYLQIGGNGREYVNDANIASIATTSGNLHIDAASGYDTYINFYDGNNIYFGNGSNTYNAYVNASGNMYATVYYDSNDTAYYLDPAGTVGGNIKQDFRIVEPTGTTIFNYQNLGQNYFRGYEHYFDQGNVRLKIAYDVDNSNYYVDPASTSNFLALNVGGNSVLTSGETTVVRHRGTITSQDWNTYVDGSEAGWYGVANMTGSNRPSAYTYGTELNFSISGQNKFQIYAPHNGTDGNGIWARTGWNADYDAWREFAMYGQSPYSGSDLRASVFYDSNNTGYYLNPADISNLQYPRAAGQFQNTGSGYKSFNYRGMVGDYDQNSTAEKIIWTIGDSWNTIGNMYGLGYTYNSTYGHHLTLKDNGAVGCRIGFAGKAIITGTVEASADFRAPIFYDTGNTGYYADPSGTSNLNVLSVVGYADFAGDAAITGGSGYGIFKGYTSNNNHLMASRCIVTGSTSSPTFTAGHDMTFVEYLNTTDRGFKFKTSHTGTYTEVAGIYTNRSEFAGSARAPIFYNSNDTNARLTANGLVLRGTSPTVYLRDTNQNSAMLHCNSNLFYILRGGNDTESWAQVNGQWPAYWNLTNNNMYAGATGYFIGDVVAYSSDERLKENIKNIDSPLEKLHKINGVTFDWKDEIDELGFVPRNKKNDVGVIAQEVEKILPQVITAAPFDIKEGGEGSKSGKDYKTVQYEKLVPLLIEAVKELSEKVKMLENK